MITKWIHDFRTDLKRDVNKKDYVVFSILIGLILISFLAG
jgi:hypothetical protein